MLKPLVIFFLIVAAMGLSYWAFVLVRVRIMLKARPSVREGLTYDLPEDAGRVSIIVPAHNEERVIDELLVSVRAQTYADIEIIIVMDRCTDGTKAIVDRHAAEDPRIIAIENDSCPPDWAGKCNACRVGTDRATGDWLLYTDADTVFEPELVRATLAIMHEDDLGLLSLLSTLTYGRSFENIAQPVATMILLRMFPVRRVKGAQRSRPFANGQFMMFKRSVYNRIGGHAAVSDMLLEDLAFARLIHQVEARSGVAIADGMLVCRMYDSLAGFCEGWRRIFIEACKRRPGRLSKLGWRLIIGSIGVPIAQILALVGAWWLGWFGDPSTAAVVLGIIVGGWILQAYAVGRIYMLSGAPWHAAAAYPIGCWIVARLLLAGARDLRVRRPVRWGGRDYVLEPRYESLLGNDWEIEAS